MNDKQKTALNKLLLINTLTWFQFDSSAQKFEDALKKLCSVPVKLYYNYKFPNNQSPEQFEYLVQGLVYFFKLFKPRQITDTDVYYREIAEQAVKNSKHNGYTSEKFFQSVRGRYSYIGTQTQKNLEKLNAVERTGIVEYIENHKANSWGEVVNLVSWLKDNNPELKSVRVNTADVVSVIDFLQGVNYGYAPEELDYFLNTDENTRNRECGEMYSQLETLGVRPEYMVRPDRLRKILDAVMMARAVAQKGKEL